MDAGLPPAPTTPDQQLIIDELRYALDAYERAPDAGARRWLSYLIMSAAARLRVETLLPSSPWQTH